MTKTDYIKAEAIIAITYPANGQAFTTSSTRVSGTIYYTIAQSKVEVRAGIMGSSIGKHLMDSSFYEPLSRIEQYHGKSYR